VLQELDEKLDGGEDLRVGSEVVGVRRAINDGVRASLVDEQVLEGDRGPCIEAFTEKPLCVQSSIFLASRSFRSLRSRKNAMTLWRKQALIFARSTFGTWMNRASRSKPPCRNRLCQWGFHRQNDPELWKTTTAAVRIGVPAASVVKSRTNA
jgi:hypothetical protein